MKNFPKIELPATRIESDGVTPVQFLPSEMLSWRAPIMTRRQPAEPRPEPARKACDAAR